MRAPAAIAILEGVVLTTVTVVGAAAVTVWWLDGRWQRGAMSTTGMLVTVGFAVAAAALIALRRILARRRR